MIEGICEVCKEKQSKYKCPKCAVKYCCVACFKTHKESENCVKSAVEEKPVEKKEVEFETEDTVPLEKLKHLADDPVIKDHLSNSFIRHKLNEINYSPDPNAEIEKAMHIPEFAHFVARVLLTVEDPKRYENTYNF